MDVVIVLVGSQFQPPACRVKLPALIGRGEDVSVAINDPLISRQHCRLEEKDGAVVVTDLSSLNGTFVGSRRIHAAICPLGELLTVGPVSFRIEPGDAEPPGVRWCSPHEMTWMAASKRSGESFKSGSQTGLTRDTQRATDSK